MVPVRFVGACPAGHLEDYPWSHFVHRQQSGQTPCTSPALYLQESHIGEFAGILVGCRSCKRSKPLNHAKC